MKVSIEKIGIIERKLTISIPSSEIDTKIDRRLLTAYKKEKIPGFRIGKAPKKMVKQRYESALTHDVVTDSINSSYKEALIQNHISPASLVSIDTKTYDYQSGKDLIYVVIVEIFPEIPSPTLKGISVEKLVCEITEKDVEDMIEDICKRNLIFDTKKKKGISEEGDRITVDFSWKTEGEFVDSGTVMDRAFVIGSKTTFKEFDQGLLGVKAGDRKEIQFHLPHGYPKKNIAGKNVICSVTVKKVEGKLLPNLEDPFSEGLGILSGGLDTMRSEVKMRMNSILTYSLTSTIKDRVMDALYSANNIEIPKVMLENELARLDNVYKATVVEQCITNPKFDQSQYVNEAKKRVTLLLVFREIIQKLKIQVDDLEIRSRIQEISKNSDNLESCLKWYYADVERIQNIKSILLEEKVIKEMLKSANVSEKTITFTELINSQMIDHNLF